MFILRNDTPYLKEDIIVRYLGIIFRFQTVSSRTIGGKNNPRDLQNGPINWTRGSSAFSTISVWSSDAINYPFGNRNVCHPLIRKNAFVHVIEYRRQIQASVNKPSGRPFSFAVHCPMHAEKLRV